MLFNSLQFLVFFQIVIAIYFSAPQRFRWALLLVSSCYFYMIFIPKFILVLFFLILIDYSAGIIIEKSTGRGRRLWLITSLVANIGMLGFFKYFTFLNSNLDSMFRWIGWNQPFPQFDVRLPIGLSFHVFQSMSYTIEVYRGRQKAERHLGIYALYVMFFPQLVAGPIERAGNLLHQFHQEHAFDYRRVMDGLKLMLWGFFKKLVIADRLAVLVDQVYGRPGEFDSLSLVMATYCFAIQIFCDFSGYSDIAIGAAHVMGFKLMDNFNRPYHAQSISEFWRRWHISLSTWFRDYLYIPLGGNRVGRQRWCLNLFLTFLISGLWHGANWTFIIWGALHGFYLIFSIWTEGIRSRLILRLGLDRLPMITRGLRALLTFHLVAFGWIFFRAHTVSDAFLIVARLFMVNPVETQTSLKLPEAEIVIILGSILFMEVVHWFHRHGQLRQFMWAQPVGIRWPVYLTTVLLIVFCGKFTSQSFIYFQF